MKRNIISRLTLVFVSVFALSGTACADDDRPIQVSQMPKAAQAFIKQHFSGSTVALAKMEKDFFGRNYKVIFTDGNQVEFNKKGEWKEVDCQYTQVPEAIVPAPIKANINQNYPNVKTLSIDKDDRGYYEVKLSNGWEITYDKKYRLIDIDD